MATSEKEATNEVASSVTAQGTSETILHNGNVIGKFSLCTNYHFFH